MIPKKRFKPRLELQMDPFCVNQKQDLKQKNDLKKQSKQTSPETVFRPCNARLTLSLAMDLRQLRLTQTVPRDVP